MEKPSSEIDLFFQTIVNSYTTNSRFLHRDWLATEVEARLASSSSGFVLLVGEPGAGKSTFMAQLAADHSTWPRYFIRRDQRTPLGDVTTHSFLLRLGYQLAIVHPELFAQETLKLGIEQRVSAIEQGGELVGAEIKRVLASPFYEKVVEIQQQVTRAEGRVVGLRVEEFVVDPRLLETDVLANMALFDPARALNRLDPKQQIVILVDALDEIRYHQTQDHLLRWLANCPALPPNLCFVMSSRPRDALLQYFCEKQAANLQLLQIEPEDVQMQVDVKTYVGRLATEPKVAVELASRGISESEFVNQIANKAQGNLGYVDSIARALDHALSRVDPTLLTALLTTQDLPADLQSLYAFFLHQIKAQVGNQFIDFADPQTGELYQKQIWPSVYTRTLGVLAVAMEPVSPLQIQELGGITAGWEYLIEALERIGPFLDLVTGHYRLYHSTVAEFLTATGTRDEPETADLYIDARRMHQEITARYLRSWGGLQAWLPDLLKTSQSASDEGYGLRRWVSHMAAANQPGILHRVLELRDHEGNNLWYRAKSSIRDVAGYRDDILRAWQLAEAESIASLQHGELPLSIHLELRYALVIASLNSLAYNIPPNLLVALLKAGTWSCQDALAYARQIPDLVQRAEALAEVAGLCPEDKEQAFREALAAAGRIGDIYWREAIFAQLAVLLPPELLGEIFSATAPGVAQLLQEYSGAGSSTLGEEMTPGKVEPGDIDPLLVRAGELPETQRVELLLEILPSLSGLQLLEALGVAKSIREEFKRTLALARLVIQLVKVGDIKTAEEAAHAIAFTHNRDRALSRFVNIPSNPEFSPSGTDNLTRARSISDPQWRAAALAASLVQLPPQDQQTVLEEALSAARTIGDRDRMNETTIRGVIWLAEQGQPDLALNIIQQISDMRWRAAGLVGVAPFLPANDLTSALVMAQEIGDPGGHAMSMAALASHLNEPEGSSWWSEVLQAVRSIEDERLFIHTVCDLSPFVPEVWRQEIIKEALSAALAAEAEEQRSMGIALLADYLPEPLLQEALTAARQLSNHEARSTAIASLAAPLARQGFSVEALGLATRDVADGHLRQDAVRSLAEYAISSKQSPLAWEAIKYLDYEHWLAGLLIRQAANGSIQQAVLIQSIERLRSPRIRAIALVRLHPYFPVNQQPPMLEEAVLALQSIRDMEELSLALQELGPGLPQDLIPRGLAIAESISRADLQGQALGGLLFSLAQGGRAEEALSKAGSIGDPYWRGLILLQLSRFVPAAKVQELEGDFLSSVEKVIDLEAGIRLCDELSLHLSRFSPDGIYAFWRHMLSMADAEEREDLLSALPHLFPILTRLGGPPLLKAVVDNIQEVCRWWP